MFQGFKKSVAHFRKGLWEIVGVDAGGDIRDKMQVLLILMSR